MRLFTVKDLINCNSPCKSCDKKPLFCLQIFSMNGASSIHCEIYENTIYLPIISTYESKLGVMIDHKTNKYEIISSASQNPKGAMELFEYFMEEVNCVIDLICNNCGTIIKSNFIEFENGFLKPISISSETIIIKEQNQAFQITTDNNVTDILVRQLDSRGVIISQQRICVDSMWLYKFKSRKQLLDKIKLYMTFN